jgi:hypothetical protein
MPDVAPNQNQFAIFVKDQYELLETVLLQMEDAVHMWRLAATFVVISGSLLGTFSTPDSDLFREELAAADTELFSTVHAKARLSVFVPHLSAP